VCFSRAEIPKFLLRFLVTNIFDKMNPTNPHFSLKKVAAAKNGDLEIKDLINNFDPEKKYTAERRE